MFHPLLNPPQIILVTSLGFHVLQKNVLARIPSYDVALKEMWLSPPSSTPNPSSLTLLNTYCMPSWQSWRYKDSVCPQGIYYVKIRLVVHVEGEMTD